MWYDLNSGASTRLFRSGILPAGGPVSVVSLTAFLPTCFKHLGLSLVSRNSLKTPTLFSSLQCVQKRVFGIVLLKILAKRHLWCLVQPGLCGLLTPKPDIMTAKGLCSLCNCISTGYVSFCDTWNFFFNLLLFIEVFAVSEVFVMYTRYTVYKSKWSIYTS